MDCICRSLIQVGVHQDSDGTQREVGKGTNSRSRVFRAFASLFRISWSEVRRSGFPGAESLRVDGWPHTSGT